MQTNILFWNIFKFGFNRFYDPFNLSAGKAQSRMSVLKAILADAVPDIFVVVEVTCGAGGGTFGAQSLLDTLRNNAADADRASWRMVPLQIVGSKKNVEQVAVYYRGQKGTVTRYFTGPFVWTGGIGGQPADPSAVSATQYANNPNSSLLVPTGTTTRTIPNSTDVQYRAGQPELQSAARIDFDMLAVASKKNPLKKLKTMPSYGTLRQPFMVTFFETDSATTPASTRNLTLFAVHAPPDYGDAYDYMTTLLANTEQIVTAPDVPKNEVKIICGDFNLNTLDDDGERSANYDALTVIRSAPAYQSLNSPPAGTTVDDDELEAYQGYFATHLGHTPTLSKTKAKSRFMWSDGTDLSPYPSYRYISSVKSAPNTYAVDNILVWRTAGTTSNFTIMNPIVGTPFDTVALPPANAPKGSLTTTCQFGNSPTTWTPAQLWPQGPSADDYVKLSARSLVEWRNYGRIRATSDHLPLFVTV